jgi:methyl-accepting chemotaxis protein
MNRCTSEVETGARLSTAASEALTKIQSGARAVSEEVASVKTAAQQMTDGLEDVFTRMQTLKELSAQNDASVSDLSSMSEEAAATSDTVAYTVADQTKGIQRVDASAGELKEMSGKLQDLVRQFKLEISAGSEHETEYAVAA